MTEEYRRIKKRRLETSADNNERFFIQESNLLTVVIK
jgi:hypothetical protein